MGHLDKNIPLIRQKFVIQLQVFYVPKTCISAWDFRFCHRTEVETGKSRPSWSKKSPKLWNVGNFDDFGDP